MWLAFEALISVFESARQAEAELAHPVVWSLIRSIVVERFPENPDMHLPEAPMRRHHYAYGRDRYLTDPSILARIRAPGRESTLSRPIRLQATLRPSTATTSPAMPAPASAAR